MTLLIQECLVRLCVALSRAKGGSSSISRLFHPDLWDRATWLLNPVSLICCRIFPQICWYDTFTKITNRWQVLNFPNILTSASPLYIELSNELTVTLAQNLWCHWRFMLLLASQYFSCIAVTEDRFYCSNVNVENLYKFWKLKCCVCFYLHC